MHILVFGDSITQGHDDYERGGWVSRLFIDISARQDKTNKEYISVFNLGVDGNTTVGVLTRIESEIVNRQDPEMVVIFDVGGNDAAIREGKDTNEVPFSEFSANYQKLIKTGKKYGKVICLGLHDSDEVLSADDASKYDSEIKRLAEENETVYIDMKGIISKNFDELTYDGDHPSPEGHRLIYERVKEEMEAAGIL